MRMRSEVARATIDGISIAMPCTLVALLHAAPQRVTLAEIGGARVPGTSLPRLGWKYCSSTRYRLRSLPITFVDYNLLAIDDGGRRRTQVRSRR